jgi:hypothetical protein
VLLSVVFRYLYKTRPWEEKMAHKVDFAIPQRDLGKGDIHVTVKKDNKKLGKLEVSRGSVVWFPRSAQKGHRATWSELDKVMQKFRRVEERKSPK